MEITIDNLYIIETLPEKIKQKILVDENFKLLKNDGKINVEMKKNILILKVFDKDNKLIKEIRLNINWYKFNKK